VRRSRKGTTGSTQRAAGAITPRPSLAAPATARHGAHWAGSGCPGYTTESHFRSNDDTIAQGVLLAAEAVYDASDRADQVLPEKGIAAAAVAAAASAHLAVSGINRVAEACYMPRHWDLEDDLMQMTLQADLASRATPDVQFVMREQRPSGHVPPTADDFPGYIDRERPDAQNGVEGWDVIGVKTTVRGVIDAMVAPDQCTCSAAESSYSQAVTAVANNQLKTAHKLFRQAYVYAFSN
jgi:hypothetical protein